MMDSLQQTQRNASWKEILEARNFGKLGRSNCWPSKLADGKKCQIRQHLNEFMLPAFSALNSTRRFPSSPSAVQEAAASSGSRTPFSKPKRSINRKQDEISWYFMHKNWKNKRYTRKAKQVHVDGLSMSILTFEPITIYSCNTKSFGVFSIHFLGKQNSISQPHAGTSRNSNA